MDTFVRGVNRAVFFVTCHWLALTNGVLALILGLSFLAPWLMLHGAPGAGQLLYLVYRALCHQLPERSFFIGGPQAVYSLEQLSAHLGYEAPLRWSGDGQLGYKVAFCERDVAIYVGWLLAGLGFALVRGRLRPLPWQGLVASLVPMAIDGLGQLVGLWESNWWRRGVTGLVFALGTLWFALPLLECGMKEANVIAQRSLEEPHAGE